MPARLPNATLPLLVLFWSAPKPMATLSVPALDPDRDALTVLNHALGGGMASRLFQEIVAAVSHHAQRRAWGSVVAGARMPQTHPSSHAQLSPPVVAAGPVSTSSTVFTTASAFPAAGRRRRDQLPAR